MEAIKNRYEFVFLFDVENGNPNGDPDAGNLPRIDPETMTGIVTDVCIKRKIRNYVQAVKENKPPNAIYVREKSILTEQQKLAYKALEEKGNKKPTEEDAKEWMCKNYYDVRTFGAVMSLKEAPCGQVRGPIQIAFGKSIDPIVPSEMTITRMAVATEAESKKQERKNMTMGRKTYVPYGLYRTEGFISAHFAEKTFFTEEDLDLFWEALINMFEHDHSSSHGKMSSRKLIIFKHQTKLGNAPAHRLFDSVDITRNTQNEKPPRSYSDYDVKIVRENIPDDVEIIEKI